MLKNSIHFLRIAIGTDLDNKVPKVSKTFDQYFFPVDTPTNHYDLTLNEFETAYKSLKRRKASGIDDINSNIVLYFYEKLKNPLLYLWSLAKRRSFPGEMKIAKCSPIFNGVDSRQTENYRNYRTISVLPVFWKTLEKVIYNRVYNYYVEDKLVFPKQFSFQITSSTEHAVLESVHNFTKSFEKNKYVLGVFIDLKKVFDTVNHEIVLHKLKLYGINGTCLEWFKSGSKMGQIISSFNSSKSIGPNSIPTKIRLQLIQVAKHLTDVFNLSFTSGVFFNSLESAKLSQFIKKL